MWILHLGLIPLQLLSGLFAVMPASGTYQLNNYGFGSGGTGNSSSANYSINGQTGQTTGGQSSSANYAIRPGNNNSQQAYVPAAPTFTNPSNYYNRLNFVVVPGASPSDTKFAIAISTDNFVTTQYIQLDDTVGNTKVYQTYAGWGGASGQQAVGLTPSTTYNLKANAIQGNYTETEFGPSSLAATVAPNIAFRIDISAIDTSTSPPYILNFPSLLAGAVVNTNEKIWVSLGTNANSGAAVYIRSANAGLKSTLLNTTITSASADLAASSTGYGGQGTSATQASGGPLTLASPYNGAGQNVGILDTTLRQLFGTTGPITSGRGSLQIEAKASNQTPSASDYSDTLTLTAAATF